jgi:ABC-type uncharacterized transport system auxiliary subunit
VIQNRAKLFAGLLLGAIFLAGCTSTQQAVLGQGIEAARQAKDAEAEVLKATVCAMSIGAYHRVNTDMERRALDVLCGGQWERPITADDLRALRALGDLSGGS